ncbi:hypothetical protein L1049_025567 [Liquidambar formosana]|uniref:J domain-containing protein n=1 Tax=Liquidambar formosana TaxID=63359 RepID=A0AAP0NEU7_LIQFO
MADFSRPLHRNQAATATLSRKLSNVHSFTGKTLYDDVFSTPPKFGAPTFSSRVEDYSEIFGSSRSSRATSVPILDLPAIDKGEVSANVRSSKFDYSQIFGGFNDVDFAVPYEELFTMPKKRHVSFEEARTPAETGSPLEGPHLSKFPEENQLSSHEASYQSFGGMKQFNMSYHKTNVGSKDGTNGTTHIAQLHAVPGFTCIVDEVTPLQRTEGNKPVPSINDVSRTMDISEGIMEGKHCRRTSSHIPNCGANRQTFEDDVQFQNGCGWNRSNANDSLFHAYEIGLKVDRSKVTRHSSLVQNFSNGKSNGASKTVTASKSEASKTDAFEGASGDCSPTFDEEVDPNSAAFESAAAVKKAIEKAQERIRIAKESMERMKEGFQSGVKPNFKDGLKVKERREVKIDDETNRFKEKKAQGTHERDNTARQDFSGTERQNAIRTGKVAPNFKDWEKRYIDKEAAGGTNGKKSVLTPVNHRLEGGEWEAAKQSCEFLSAGNCVEAILEFEQADGKKKTMQSLDESERKKSKPTMENFELPELNGKKLKAVEEAIKREEFERKPNVVNGVQEWEEQANKSKSVGKIHEQEEIEKKLKVAREKEGIEEKLKASQEQEKCEKKLRESLEPMKNEKKLETEKWDQNKNEKRLNEAQKLLEIEMEQKKDHEREENEKRLKEVREREENEKRKQLEIEMVRKRAREQEENEKRLKEVREREENEKRLREVHEREENEKRLREIHEREENEKRLKEDREKEENEKRLREEREREGSEKRLKEVHEREEKEKRFKEDCEREEKENKLKEVREREENEKRLKEIRGQEEYEKRLKEDFEWVEYEKKPKESCGWVENEKQKDAHTVQDQETGLDKVHEQAIRLNDPREMEESEKRLKKDCEWEGYEKPEEAQKKEENDKMLKEAHWMEGNEKKEKEALRYVEKNHPETYDACKQVENEELSRTQEACRHKENDNNAEVTHEVLAHEESWRMLEATTASCEPEENEEEWKAVKVAMELGEKDLFRTACWAQGALERNKIENNMKDESEAFLFEDNGANEPEEDEEESKAVKLVNELEEKEMFNTDFWAKDALEDDEIEKLTHELGGNNKNVKEAEVAFDKVEEKNNFKAAHGEKQWVDSGKKMEASQLNSVFEGVGKTLEIAQENKTSQSTEKTKENLDETLTMEEREAKETTQKEVDLEKEHLRDINEAKERGRERERERIAVERAIREARERAFAEARERAERAAVERATAEARQRVMAEAREKLDKPSADVKCKSIAEKVSMEAKLRAERAAVERATAEARERALEKALSEKAASKARERTERFVAEKVSGSSSDNGMRQSFLSSDPQYQGSGPSSSLRYSNSSNYGVPHATERFDDGARNESSQRCNEKLEKHQRIVERAAKALEEKNKRDLLAQKEQAERNRLAEALDADVKRWSSGKAGNLRALLSTLQYILGPDSGWQAIPLTDIVTTNAVKKAYRKATLFVHPDKLQQRGASIQQKYICEKVFDLLKEAWNKFNPEER